MSSSPSAKAPEIAQDKQCVQRELADQEFPPRLVRRETLTRAPQQPANYLRKITESLVAGMRKSADSYARIECKAAASGGCCSWLRNRLPRANSAVQHEPSSHDQAEQHICRHIHLVTARSPAAKRTMRPPVDKRAAPFAMSCRFANSVSPGCCACPLSAEDKSSRRGARGPCS